MLNRCQIDISAWRFIFFSFLESKNKTTIMLSKRGLKGNSSAQVLKDAVLLSHLTSKMRQGWLPRTVVFIPRGSYSQENGLIFLQLSAFNLIFKVKSMGKNTCFSAGAWGQVLVGASRNGVPCAIISHRLAKSAEWCPHHPGTI